MTTKITLFSSICGECVVLEGALEALSTTLERGVCLCLCLSFVFLLFVIFCLSVYISFVAFVQSLLF